MHSRNQSDQYNTGMNYVDGVPVKIGEKFKPPRKITLPLNFYQRDPIELLKDDYNFHLEKQVLEWSENFRKRKEAKSKAKVEQVGHQIEQFTRFPPSSPEGQLGSSDNSPNSVSTLPSSSGDSIPDTGVEGSGNDSSNELGQPPISCALLANLETNDILKPTPLDLPSVPTNHSFTSDSQSNNPIKLEDFESESSPFDSVELKTLNDMEELKSVLQGIGNSPLTKSENLASAHTEGNVLRLQTKSVVNGTIQYFPSGSHMNGVVSYSTNYHHPAPNSFLSSSKDSFRNDDIKAVTSLPTNLIPPTATNFPISYTSVDTAYTSYVNNISSLPTSNLFSSPFYSQASIKMDNQCHGSQLSDYNLLSSTYLASDLTGQPSATTLVGTPGSDSSSSSGSLRNAHSTPDLLKELGKTHREEKRHPRTYPPRPNSVGSVEEAEDVYHSYEQKGRFPHINLKDVFSELNSEEQTLVRRMVDMGFPQARAARAVQKLGNDDKKVVEHLCAVQSLTEKGFIAEKCEIALFLHDQNEIAALEYLQLMKQFLDLGFEEEKIKRALCLTKNNRDKALDYLVS